MISVATRRRRGRKVDCQLQLFTDCLKEEEEEEEEELVCVSSGEIEDNQDKAATGFTARDSRLTCSEFTWTLHNPAPPPPPAFPLLTRALTCVFVRLGVINRTWRCLAYCMFLDVGNALRMSHLLLSQLL